MVFQGTQHLEASQRLSPGNHQSITERGAGDALSTNINDYGNNDNNIVDPASHNQTNGNNKQPGSDTSRSRNSSGQTRKKRRLLSCESCRKLKTRCDKTATGSKCHRCLVLRINCSLAGDSAGESSSFQSAEPVDSESDNKESDLPRKRQNSMSQTVDIDNNVNQVNDDERHTDSDNALLLILQKLDMFESKFDQLSQKVELLQKSHVKQEQVAKYHTEETGSSGRDNTADSNSANDTMKSLHRPPVISRKDSLVSNTLINDSIDNIQLDFYESSSPSQMINQIDNVILHKSNDYKSFRVMCNEFIELFEQNRQRFLKLAKSFLKISHFWIIPGGIKKIDTKYVQEHPFISCVFVLIGMCFDENDSYIEEQKVLFNLTMRLLGKALLVDKLTDHDIEAIVYIATFNISKKVETDQFSLNKWLTTTFAVNHVVQAFNFQEIFTLIVYHKIFDKDQLFHIRIFNSLLISSLQASLDCNRPVFLTNDYLNFSKIILKFPKNMLLVGDKIIVSKLYLLLTIVNLINDQNFAVDILNDMENLKGGHAKYVDSENLMLKISALEVWKDYNKDLIKSDVAKILLNGYYYYYIYLSKRIMKDLEVKYRILYPVQGKSFTKKQWKNLSTLRKICFRTSIKYCLKLLKNIFRLKPKFIKGSPIFQNNQIIYAALTLLNSLSSMSSLKNKSMSIELIGKVYWRLTKLGIKKNDATDTLEKVLKLVIDAAMKDHSMLFENVADTAGIEDSSKNTATGMHEMDVNINDKDDEFLQVHPHLLDVYHFSADSDGEDTDGEICNNDSETSKRFQNADIKSFSPTGKSPNQDHGLGINRINLESVQPVVSDIRRATSFSADRATVNLNSTSHANNTETASSSVPEPHSLRLRSYSENGQLYHTQRQQFMLNHRMSQGKSSALSPPARQQSLFAQPNKNQVTRTPSPFIDNLPDFQLPQQPSLGGIVGSSTYGVATNTPASNIRTPPLSNSAVPGYANKTPSSYSVPMAHHNSTGSVGGRQPETIAESPEFLKQTFTNFIPSPFRFPSALYSQQQQPQFQYDASVKDTGFVTGFNQDALNNIDLPNISDYDNFTDFYRDMFVNIDDELAGSIVGDTGPKNRSGDQTGKTH